ncbi:putative MFS multidrug transporter-1 [Coleophoma cylindrospora]|uniref:Putative MFS multidrug transporter-1 n=1 Tax=Coleophoma cylindrospora TaxID=1849047 RepID=A0A3D8QNZ5_9HELO|nr:putative MFS multidrug transporter-1 [Coleophoma cylindrospora]
MDFITVPDSSYRCQDPSESQSTTCVSSRRTSLSNEKEFGYRETKNGPCNVCGRMGEKGTDKVGSINSIESQKSLIVDWDGDNDPERPTNWPLRKKLAYTFTAATMVFGVSFSSSVFGPATRVTASLFGVSIEVMDLSISFFLLGLAFGPSFFGPMSEVLGHLIPLSIGMGGFMIFQIPMAVAGNVQTILISRFFQGFFSSAIQAVIAGMIVDVWSPIVRGVAIAIPAACMTGGSTLAPTVGTYVTESLGWRWIGWITLIYLAITTALGFLFLHHSSPRVILTNRAQKRRFETGNWALHSKYEESPVDFKLLMQKYLTKPIRIFFKEPILIILTIYLTLVYGIFYISYQAFLRAFEARGWPATTASLPFLSSELGVIASCCTFSLFIVTWWRKRFLRRNAVTPEDCLPIMIIGSCILPPALLWFGWSTYTHWASQVIACFVIGWALMLVFITGIVYIVDVYTINANSAMSIHIAVRSVVASSFPLWTTPMFDRLGVDWGMTVLAACCFVMIPFPVLFWMHGGKIRSWSKFSFSTG